MKEYLIRFSLRLLGLLFAVVFAIPYMLTICLWAAWMIVALITVLPTLWVFMGRTEDFDYLAERIISADPWHYTWNWDTTCLDYDIPFPQWYPYIIRKMLKNL